MKALNSASKFNRDLLWNMGSFGFIAVAGVLINILIVAFYDSSALGVFNQVYAIYILLSQLAVGGVHLSVQFYTPRYAGQPHHTKMILSTALAAAAALSLLVIALAYPLAPVVARMLESEQVGTGLYAVLWGLLFFSLNKVLLSGLNGMRRMKAFAVFQFLRFAFMLILLCGIIYYRLEPVYLACVLPLAEVLLFIPVIIYCARHISFRLSIRTRRLLFIQYRYGNRALLGNFLLDVNTKVDIFVLGIFLSDAAVGVYSFASTVAEGFFQLPTLLRNNINPVITQALSRRNPALLQYVLRRNIRAFYKLLIVLALLSIVVFPLIPLVAGVEELFTTWTLYAILVGTVALTAGYHPFLMIFNQMGRPSLQTLFIFFIFAVNLVFNILLIPFTGVYGAAIGTAISFIGQVIAMKYLLRVKFGLHV